MNLKRYNNFNENEYDCKKPDRKLVHKYLEILEDIFEYLEDEMGINLDVLFYEFNPKNRNIYNTIDSKGNESSFYTTSRHIFGYFSIGYHIEKSKTNFDLTKSKTLNDCLSMIDKYFDYSIDVEKSIKPNFVSVCVILNEPLV